jgi:hypothetical protein
MSNTRGPNLNFEQIYVVKMKVLGNKGRQPARKKKPKLINWSVNLCLVIASVFILAWQEVFIIHSLKEVMVLVINRTLIFEITNQKLRPVVSHSGIWRSVAVVLLSVARFIFRYIRHSFLFFV